LKARFLAYDYKRKEPPAKADGSLCQMLNGTEVELSGRKETKLSYRSNQIWLNNVLTDSGS